MSENQNADGAVHCHSDEQRVADGGEQKVEGAAHGDEEKVEGGARGAEQRVESARHRDVDEHSVDGPADRISVDRGVEGPLDRDRLLDHAYDGIREYDNRLPNWWQYILYGSIVFSVGYWLVFHIYTTVPLPHGRYDEEMAKAAEVQLAKMAGQELTDDALQLMSTIPDRVSAGQQLFQQFCVVCHGASGEGNVGPNLTDEYWLHGPAPLQIHETVTHGVLDKGMAAWGSQLGPARVQQVVAYVLTLKGKNVPGKQPQGEKAGPPADGPVEAAPPNDAPAMSHQGATDMGIQMEGTTGMTNSRSPALLSPSIELTAEQMSQP